MNRHIDYYLFFVVAALVIYGALFLSTLSATVSLRTFGTTNYYLFHQLITIAIGAVLGFIAFKIPLHIVKKFVPILLGINLLLLFSVFLPFFGSKYWGAHRWLNFGKFVIQPSEFLKITAILYFSAWISSKFSESQQKNWIAGMKKGYYNLIYILLPFALFLAIITVALYLQKDISTLGVITISLLIVYFSAKTPLWHTLSIIVAGIGAFLLFIKLEPYRLNRLQVFLHPETDPMGIGYQVKQSLIAVGSGGFFGKGWGLSSQKFGFLPQAMTDSFFAVLGEETGILGCSVLILLFLAFLWLGIKIAKNSKERFAKLTAIGIVSWITVQAFVNISSSIGIFPLGGIPLPFFSYGGSHIIAELASMGILLNISKS